MNVYCGPRKKVFSFSKEFHKHTDTVDIAENSFEHRDCIAVQINVTTERAEKRRSVSTIFFNAKDVADLNAIMTEIHSKKMELLKEKAMMSDELGNLLRQIREAVGGSRAASSDDHAVQKVRQLLGIGEKKQHSIKRPLRRPINVEGVVKSTKPG